MRPKYSEIEVQLTGEDGNAFAILGRVSKALHNADIPREEIDTFIAEATSGDYEHLFMTCAKWVTVL